MSPRPRDTSIFWMDRAVTMVEGVVAGVLVLVAAYGAVAVAWTTVRTLLAPGGLNAVDFNLIIEATLGVFIVVELFRIAVAYMRHKDVLPTVLEAGLVAVARKIVTFNVHTSPQEIIMKAGAFSMMLLAIGITWYLLAKRNPGLLELDGDPVDPSVPQESDGA